ncbi:MAG: lytic transglycosylase domain-containing protein [Alphaproteobacteria bacterium]|nr:lytic transglycosylase domain-containing protein [Alphaproteobacteria bacterium]
MRFHRNGAAAAVTVRALVTASLGIILLTQPAAAEPTLSNGGKLCTQAINSVEQQLHLPRHLLLAIGRVESGRRDPATGHVEPWPWAMDAAGAGRLFNAKQDVVNTVATLGLNGVRSVDVGCMQVNLAWHPNAFASLDEAFDPYTNARYAGLFLQSLYRETGNWAAAVAAYHSRTPAIGAGYSDRVMATWDPSQRPTFRTARLDAGMEYSVVNAPPADPISEAARSKLHVPGRTQVFALRVARDNSARRLRDAAMLGSALRPELYQTAALAGNRRNGAEDLLEAGQLR